jgi:hypothetical protein
MPPRRTLLLPGLAAMAAVAAVVAAAALAAGSPGEILGLSDGTSSQDSEQPVPAEDAPIPRDPERLATALTDVTLALREDIERWRSEGDPARGAPPEEVTLRALYQQRIYLLLGARRRLADSVLPLLPGSVSPEARDTLAARRALHRLNPPTKRKPGSFRTGPALPAGVLRDHYGAAQRRFRVHWSVLAAINLVETGYNRIRSNSTAGAQGPMQFIPSTWRAYGMGGNIHNPRDAIMGAANYLRASGAPADYDRALFAYNRSSLYVKAVKRYARRIRLDRRAYFAYYSWQIFVRTPRGAVRLTGP